VDEIEGLPGELVDRLIDLMNSDALGERAWYDVTSYATVFIGGTALQTAVPDTGGTPAPGTVGEHIRQSGELASREEYFELIRDRLRELVANGVEEAFLVRSLRDAVHQMLEHMADVGAGDRKRAELRDHFLRTADDPARIAAFRARLAESDASAETLSDDEVAAMLRQTAGGDFLGPTSPESAVERWAMLTRWDEQVASLLPDAAFEEWHLRRLRKLRPS
jgi:hypothetical protein